MAVQMLEHEVFLQHTKMEVFQLIFFCWLFGFAYSSPGLLLSTQ